MSELADYIEERLNDTYREKVAAAPPADRWILTHCNFCGREKSPEEITLAGIPWCHLGLGCDA